MVEALVSREGQVVHQLGVVLETWPVSLRLVRTEEKGINQPAGERIQPVVQQEQRQAAGAAVSVAGRQQGRLVKVGVAEERMDAVVSIEIEKTMRKLRDKGKESTRNSWIWRLS